MKQGSTRNLLGAVLALAVLAIGGCQDSNAGGAPSRHAKQSHGGHALESLPSIPKRPGSVSVAAVLEKAKQTFSTLPKTFDDPRNPSSPEKIALGRMLYYDTRLSKNHDLSCASCHDLEKYGVDPREGSGARNKTSLGHRGQLGDRNAPTVYNAGLHLAQFWDGRARDLEDQAKGPVLNPVNMAIPDVPTWLARRATNPGTY